MMYPALTISAIDLEDYMLPCLNKQLLGIDCPGCGLQRSVDLLLHGEFVAAFQMYPAIYPMLALLAFLVTSSFTTIKYSQYLKMALVVMTAGTIIISYILKMNNLFN
ncbi:DUF2752 domain-containing protein [Flagellimonas oceanensis]|uniref:DUF2752 domain-containing protein n=1 Tax=Flagellimonas oceanensis TaxID=2499163 RepID=UPI001F35E68C|nr:DUF2752 domain-containing protein [Allomuricauda oceanensis]|tara:strand:- start:2023 stop:2343 length:321 start_codon:yes stop_codon:yes gene_type:complete